VSAGREDEALSPTAFSRIDDICDRYEKEWKAGRRPHPEHFLAGVGGPGRTALLRELLLLDLHYRAQAGERPNAQEYRRRLPGYEGLIEELFSTVPPSPPDDRGKTSWPETRNDNGTPPLPEGTLGTEWPPQAGRYRIEGKIAEGGMGVVLRAHDPELNRPLAIKVIKHEFAGRVELERRFLEEAQVTGQLQHPGVPPIHDIGRLEEGRLFFAMKLIRGRTLAELLNEREGPAEGLPRWLAVFEQVCQAVGYAHSKGVIHRDLKPGNVMVGAFGEVQVMDWGLAKVLKSGREVMTTQLAEASTIETARMGDSEEWTRPDTLLGTLPYMAPEQARGEVGRVDERADVFGLGAMLCVILTGQAPYRGPDYRHQAQQADLADSLARLDGCGAELELIRLARACLAAELSERPPNAGAVAEAVRRYQRSVAERLQQAELERAHAQVQAREERKRRRIQLALAVTVLLLALAVVAGGSAWVLQQQQAATSARRIQAEDEVRDLLVQARGLLEEGWQSHNLAKVREAKAKADRAADIARTAQAGPAVQRESREFQAVAAKRLERVNKNRGLLEALLEVTGPQESSRDKAGELGQIVLAKRADEQYAAAFRYWWNLDIDKAQESEIVERFLQEPQVVVQDLVAVLDSWMLVRRRLDRPLVPWSHLVSVANRLDRWNQRRQLREVLLLGDPRKQYSPLDILQARNLTTSERVPARRLLAQWLLSIGGGVKVRVAGRSREIRDAKDLPAGDLELVAINLSGSRHFGDAGLARLKGLVTLAELRVGGTQVTNAGLAHLNGLPALTELSLARTEVGEGLKHLEVLTGLRRLDLTGCNIRGPQLAHLKGLHALTDLRLGCPTLTDLGVKHLAGLKRLERLSLAGSQVTDEGLKALPELRILSELDLAGTKVTAAGVADLQKALPKCRIFSGLKGK
jgi:hypothetical protein